METTGRVKDITRDWKTNKLIISLIVDASPSEEVQRLSTFEKLKIKIAKFSEKRSLNANALMWECLDRIAQVQLADKWDIYLLMLKRYGVFTYVCVIPEAVEMYKQQWRACEEIGEVNINGRKAVQLLCYFGSSTYDTKQFSRLLDGIISEMKDMGLEPPTSKEMQRSLDLWERMSSTAHA